jgi:hypothetical protein
MEGVVLTSQVQQSFAVARIYGFANYRVNAQLSNPIRYAKVELWEDAVIDKGLPYLKLIMMGITNLILLYQEAKMYMLRYSVNLISFVSLMGYLTLFTPMKRSQS